MDAFIVFRVRFGGEVVFGGVFTDYDDARNWVIKNWQVDEPDKYIKETILHSSMG